MKIIIAGGTGFVGRSVVRELLSQGHEVLVLSRRCSGIQSAGGGKPVLIPWDGETPGVWCSAIEGADAVINFSGQDISARRWTREYKRVLRESRVGPTRSIVRAIAACAKPPRVLINASAVGYYGDSGDRLLDEASDRGSGFLTDLCLDWERAACEARNYGVRVVVLRMGVVIGKGGVLDKFTPPFQWYLGGSPGSGRQWMSWISARDLAEIVLFALCNSDLEGPVNCVSPDPLTMNDFCSALGSALRRPSWIRCPAFVLRLALGEMAQVVLSGQRVVPRRLLDAGFRFKNPVIDGILFETVHKR